MRKGRVVGGYKISLLLGSDFTGKFLSVSHAVFVHISIHLWPLDQSHRLSILSSPSLLKCQDPCRHLGSSILSRFSVFPFPSPGRPMEVVQGFPEDGIPQRVRDQGSPQTSRGGRYKELHGLLSSFTPEGPLHAADAGLNMALSWGSCPF